MKRSRGLLCRRELLVLSGLVLIVAACGKSISSLETLAPTATPKSTNTPIPNTPLPTDTPTPEPSPTISPTPDWESMDNSQLLERAPRKEGYAKESVIGHDTGRYVTYRNQESGRVEWVFNTEVQEFERGAESVWSTEVDGQRVDIKALFVTSKEYEEKYGDHLEIHGEDEGLFAKHFLAISAVEYYDQRSHGGPHNNTTEGNSYSTLNLSGPQRDELVKVCVEGGRFSGDGYPERDFGGGYLRDVVLAGQDATLGGMHVRPDAFVFKIGYDRRVEMGSAVVPDMDGGGLIHTMSPDGVFVLKLNTSQDILSPVASRGCNDTGCYDFLHYPEFGWIPQAIDTIGSNRLLFGRHGEPPDFPRSLIRGIMSVSYGENCFPNYPRLAGRPGDYNPLNIDFPPLMNLPALGRNWGGTGDWLGGIMVEGP
jgi:hypothetical protein